MCSSGASDQWAERCKQECDRTHADELLWAALDDGVLELVLAEEAGAAEVSTVCAAVTVTTEAEAAWVEVAAWDEEGAEHSDRHRALSDVFHPKPIDVSRSETLLPAHPVNQFRDADNSVVMMEKTYSLQLPS